MSRKIIVGSRRSRLALTQTRWVIQQLEALNLPYTFEIKEIVTKGDRIVDVMLSKVGGKGLFIKEIEQAMLDGDIDMAVHSMKDMPAELPDEFVIGCIPTREDPRDCLIANDHVRLADLPSGSVVGTSSLRRSAQILHYRPDLKIRWIRGNIDTRLRKLKEENYDAIILAAAGMKRMGWEDERITEYLPLNVCLPAIGQGALGIECRKDDHQLHELLRHIHDRETMQTVRAERAFLAEMDGSCHIPLAGYARMSADGRQVALTGLVGTPDGKTILKETLTDTDPLSAGQALAERLKERGAGQILDQVREDWLQ